MRAVANRQMILGVVSHFISAPCCLLSKIFSANQGVTVSGLSASMLKMRFASASFVGTAVNRHHTPLCQKSVRQSQSNPACTSCNDDTFHIVSGKELIVIRFQLLAFSLLILFEL